MEKIILWIMMILLAKGDLFDYEDADEDDETLMECAKENNVDFNHLNITYNDTMSLKDSILSIYDENYALRCLGRCYNIKIGIMEPDRSNFNYDLYQELYYIEKNNFKEIVDECTLENQQEDECDRNHAIDKCIQVQTEPGIYIDLDEMEGSIGEDDLIDAIFLTPELFDF